MTDGRLAYLDFGSMGEIGLPIRRGLIRATLHLVNREYLELADDFVMLGLLPPDADRNQVVPALTGVFQEALRDGVANLSFGQLSGDLGRTMFDFKFQIPAYYTLLVRSLSVLEGIALSSDKDYKACAIGLATTFLTSLKLNASCASAASASPTLLAPSISQPYFPSIPLFSPVPPSPPFSPTPYFHLL